MELRYRFLFLDVDDTILDFTLTERAAYARTLASLGIAPTPEILDRYHVINEHWWEVFERGEAGREEILLRRHEQLFSELGVVRDSALCEEIYRTNLAIGHYFVPGAPELLQYLYDRGYELYIASNGVARTQYSRLESAGIGHYFREIFISETTGHHKPERAYFDYCFARIPGFAQDRALLIGDSLSSDIRGGKAAGIHTCWFNRKGKAAPPELRPDYEIHSLDALYDLL